MFYKIPARPAGISMPGQKSQNTLIKPVMNGRNCIVPNIIFFGALVVIVITLLTNTPEGFAFKYFYRRGILLHKMGELFLVLGIGLPWILSYFISEKTNRKFTWFYYLLALLGGIANLEAWYMLKGNYWWHVWCVFLFAMGFISYLFIRIMIKKAYLKS